MTERFDLRITAGASSDLELLHAYVRSTRSLAQADELLHVLIEKAESLQTFPHRGSIPHELMGLSAGDVRQTLAWPYRIIYRIAGETVYVVIIADGRRDLRTLLQQRLLGN